MMRKKTDAGHLALRRIDEVSTGLKRHKVPENIVKDFEKACLSAENLEEKGGLLDPLAKHLLQRSRFLKGKSKPGVRAEGGLPQSIISAATMEIFDALRGRLDHLPVMRGLLIEILDVKDYRNRMGRQPEEREAALCKLALQPDTGIRELARVTGVSPSTASRWLKNTEFNQQLDQLKTQITDPRLRKACEDSLTYTLLSDEKLNHNGGV